MLSPDNANYEYVYVKMTFCNRPAIIFLCLRVSVAKIISILFFCQLLSRVFAVNEEFGTPNHLIVQFSISAHAAISEKNTCLYHRDFRGTD